MKATFRLIACLLASSVVLAADGPLFAVTATQSTEGGPVSSTLQFKELERTPTTSIVEMSYEPRRSVPDQVELIRCVCLLMKYRDEQFVSVASIPNERFRFEVTFPKSDPAAGTLKSWPLSVEQCKRWIRM